ncbi:hypothetical protein PCASD_12784 [Puccinia coronata f. sp. avenae]|uniref:Uncharacterized protein n=1 Tax=Puccinia coronata f. sp. avenae TaxID=200324 RepID=A0A2N5SZ86_9BASI|nr:hypothetical protein PCASD_12784 [Puccinia coronata f. sp. avenae]
MPTGNKNLKAYLPLWIFIEKLVVKPDQLIKHRGQAGRLGLKKTWPKAQAWIQERAGKPVNVKGIVSTLNTFIVKPFAPHPSDTTDTLAESSYNFDWQPRMTLIKSFRTGSQKPQCHPVSP